MVDSKYLDLDDEKPDTNEGRYREFECPECNAHNPYDDGFQVGDEIQCFYCGTEFKVTQNGSQLKFRPT